MSAPSIPAAVKDSIKAARAVIEDSIKAVPLAAVKRSPEIKFGWCRLHLREAGYILRGERGTKRVVVWKRRRPNDTEVWFDSIDDLIDVVENKRWNLLAPPKSADEEIEDLIEEIGNSGNPMSEEEAWEVIWCIGPNGPIPDDGLTLIERLRRRAGR